MLKKTISLSLILISIFFAFNILSKLLINENTKQHALESEYYLLQEGLYYNPIPSLKWTQRDNFTDAIMISSSVCRIDRNLINDALCNPVYSINEDSSLVSNEEYNPIKSAIYCIENNLNNAFSYGRYWHGYNIVLTPLLCFFNIREIRIINFILLYILAIISLSLIAYKLGKFTGIAYLITLLAIGFPLIPYNLQFSTCFYITFISIIVILTIKESWFNTTNSALLFLIIGASTSYLDLLTTPLLTFGLPATILLLYINRPPSWKLLILIGAYWCFGYFGLWVSKWLLTLIFTPFDILGNATQAVGKRIGTAITIESVIKYRIFFLAIMLMAVTYLFHILMSYLKHKLILRNKELLSFIILAFLPILWIIAFQNHSILHLWFVWRIIGISIFNTLIFFKLSHKIPITFQQLMPNASN